MAHASRMEPDRPYAGFCHRLCVYRRINIRLHHPDPQWHFASPFRIYFYAIHKEFVDNGKKQLSVSSIWEKYPVISISLKDVEGTDFQIAYDMLGSIISEETGRFGFLLESPRLTQAEKKKTNRLIEGEFEKAFSLHSSLRLLTQL